MRAVVWQGKNDVRVEDVADPGIQQPTDAVIRVTSTAICGSDLHLLDPLAAFMSKGDVLGHEAMGVVEEVGSAIGHLAPGDRVVVPFPIACGRCFMCSQGLHSQCETTQVRTQGTGAALFGYSMMYGSVPGGQAQYLRVPMAHAGPVKVSTEGPDERYLFLSDVVPTAWQAAVYAAVPDGGTAVVFGLGPVGLTAALALRHLGAARVVAVEPEADRRAAGEQHGFETLDPQALDDVPLTLVGMLDGRGPDAVVDAVGMEAHGSPGAAGAQKAAGLLPDALARPFVKAAGVDRLSALQAAVRTVRRGGTVSVVGVYGGEQDPLPMREMFDKQIQLRMGQANVQRWLPELLPLVDHPADPLGVTQLASHRLPLEQAPEAYASFRDKEAGWRKVVLDPWAA